ncbi:ATP-binding protein [Bacillus sp. FJAT-45350]|uniref:ATP-binding protein n=1 Tax=Bacillus sp. FJAT-45350 TaxID=2011014 RepID=UPI000BB9A854|nr:ATP-binding protein [Bacillus sp. FJAT-45350]
MQSIKDSIHKNMAFSSDVCEKHNINLMDFSGEVVCPRCFLEKENEKVQQREEEKYLKRNYLLLNSKSLVSDKTILNATLDNFKPTCAEEKNNKQLVKECINRYKDGQVFNVVLQGLQGTGKSHLAYAMLKELNENSNFKASCLFMSVEEMIRKIKGTFKDDKSIYTENYFIDLISQVDYLVLDDLGAETGAIGTDKSATDFVQRVLYAITTTRQDKSTIITTNLASATIFGMYDRKLVSRLFKKPKYIVFRESKDKRIADIPF